ncbi:hypothetical protein GGI15_002287 [Coemansia interrupta]|uniref:Metaxin n=1 Tax=Coemansia interrupta TaxID=1126814 RepID=A0A9W8HHV9_9FUNG|nr:hypothetical protein GGI15_002287 [Coemansia interrupta]
MYSLYSWGSPFEELGIYSFDPSCVSVQAYMQLCKVEWKLHRTSNTAISPNSCLPALVYNNTLVESGFWRIVQFLKSEGYDLNSRLDSQQLSQSTAYISLIQDSLVDALLFSWYMVSENFADTIRPRMAKTFGFPLSLLVPTQIKDYAEERLRYRGIASEVGTTDAKSESAEAGSPGTDSRLQSLKSKIPRIYLLAKEGFRRHADKSAHPVYVQASDCLELLSKKLGDKSYFFGDTPSALDAVAYGYLSLIIRPDLPQNTLKDILSTKYPNLVALCDRIHSQLEKPEFANDEGWVHGIVSAIKHSVVDALPLSFLAHKSAKDEPEDPELGDKARSVVGALFVFFGYIVYNGVFSNSAK